MSAWLVDFGAQYGVDYAMHGVGQWKMTDRRAVLMKTISTFELRTPSKHYSRTNMVSQFI